MDLIHLYFYEIGNKLPHNNLLLKLEKNKHKDYKVIDLMGFFFSVFVCFFVVVVIITSKRKLHLALEKEMSCGEFTREAFKDRDKILKFLLFCIFITDLTHPWDIFQWSLQMFGTIIN